MANERGDMCLPIKVVGPYSPPMPPENVQASQSEYKNWVVVVWDASDTAQGYYICRDGSVGSIAGFRMRLYGTMCMSTISMNI